MKYICTKSEAGEEEIFLFPDTINHDDMADSLQSIKMSDGRSWIRIYRKPISAGFIDKSLRCFGRSETLGLKSRVDIDTVLLKRLM